MSSSRAKGLKKSLELQSHYNLRLCGVMFSYATCTYLFVIHVAILRKFSAATSSMRYHRAALYRPEEITAPQPALQNSIRRQKKINLQLLNQEVVYLKNKAKETKWYFYGLIEVVWWSPLIALLFRKLDAGCKRVKSSYSSYRSMKWGEIPRLGGTWSRY